MFKKVIVLSMLTCFMSLSANSKLASAIKPIAKGVALTGSYLVADSAMDKYNNALVVIQSHLIKAGTLFIVATSLNLIPWTPGANNSDDKNSALSRDDERLITVCSALAAAAGLSVLNKGG